MLSRVESVTVLKPVQMMVDSLFKKIATDSAKFQSGLYAYQEILDANKICRESIRTLKFKGSSQIGHKQISDLMPHGADFEA